MKKTISMLTCLFIVSAFPIFAFANSSQNIDFENIPIIDDSIDYSTEGVPTFTYEDDYIIQSYELTDEEVELGQQLQALHTHPSLERHISSIAHTHSIENIKDGTPKYYVWRPSEIWTRNSLYPSTSDWPTVSWTTGQSTTASASVSTSVGVSDGTVSSTLGASFTKSHTISTNITRSFKVPYQRDGRVKVNYYRYYKTFTCVTTYFTEGFPPQSYRETGAGSAIGAPYDLVCNLETKTY